MILLEKIDRFGVLEITGRSILYAGETKRMQAAQNIVNTYYSMIRAQDRSKWTADHKDAARLMYELEKLSND